MFRTLHHTGRVFKNRMSDEVVRLETRPEGATHDELAELGDFEKFRMVFENGDPEYGVWG